MDITHAIDEQKEKERVFRSAFLTSADGQKAFEWLLIDLHFLTPAVNEHQQALNNYAKELVALVYGEQIQKRTLFGFINDCIKKMKGKLC